MGSFTFTASDDTSLTGQTVVASPGSFTFTASSDTVVTGLSVTSSRGSFSFTADSDTAVSGLSVTASVGAGFSFVSDVNFPLSGLSVTASDNDFVSESAPIFHLTGQSVTAAIADFSIDADDTLTLTGLSVGTDMGGFGGTVSTDICDSVCVNEFVYKKTDATISSAASYNKTPFLDQYDSNYLAYQGGVTAVKADGTILFKWLSSDLISAIDAWFGSSIVDTTYHPYLQALNPIHTGDYLIAILTDEVLNAWFAVLQPSPTGAPTLLEADRK